MDETTNDMPVEGAEEEATEAPVEGEEVAEEPAAE